MTSIGRRRTPGLRREEVAQLAGISIAYYTWIEQGRDLNMSPDVLNALARALRFSKAERTHLFTLARLEASEGVVDDPSFHPTLAYLLSNAESVCALKYDPWFNVLAATRLATAVFGLQPDDGLDANLLYRLFADPAQRRLWVDWESEAHMLVGMFRQSLAKWPAASAGQHLLENLIQTPDFTSVWQAYDVRLQPSPDEYFRAEPWELYHPMVGVLHIHRIAMTIPTQGGRTLVLTSPAERETVSKFAHLMELDRPRPQLSLVKA